MGIVTLTEAVPKAASANLICYEGFLFLDHLLINYFTYDQMGELLGICWEIVEVLCTSDDQKKDGWDFLASIEFHSLLREATPESLRRMLVTHYEKHRPRFADHISRSSWGKPDEPDRTVDAFKAILALLDFAAAD